MKDYIKVGDKVSHSPVGAGVITDFTERGYPRVNHVAVAWLRFETGEVFNPYGTVMLVKSQAARIQQQTDWVKELKERSMAAKKITEVKGFMCTDGSVHSSMVEACSHQEGLEFREWCVTACLGVMGSSDLIASSILDRWRVTPKSFPDEDSDIPF